MSVKWSGSSNILAFLEPSGYYPYNPRKSGRQVWRAYMRQGVYNWQYFSPETKDIYNKARYPMNITSYAGYPKKYLKAQAQYRTS